MKSPTLNRLDRFGSVLSSLCAVHCLCMPVLIGVLPVLGLSFLADRALERGVTGAMVLFATGCLWLGCRTHGRWSLFTLLGAGAGLVGYVQLTAADCCARHAFNWRNALLMTAGGVLIATTHLLNRRLRARCECGACAAQGVKFNFPSGSP